MRTRTIGFGVIVLLVALLCGGAVLVRYRTQSAQSRADAIIARCAPEKDHAACYERLVPALYPSLSVGEMFDVVRAITHSDSTYKFCHVLAHKIGERVIAEDPSKWVDALPLNPADGFCSNGFIHGVIGGRFRAEVLDGETIRTLLPDFRRACEPHNGWEPSDLDKAMCYHAMGHLYDYITNADLDAALALCEETTTDQFRRVCREGVFMQIYQPLEPDDFALIEQMPVKPTPETVRQFCGRFAKAEYEGACLRESWPMQPGMTDGTGARSLCSEQPNAQEETACYESVTAIIGRMNLDDPAKAAAACQMLPVERREMCFATVAQAVLEEDRNNAQGAVALCERADEETARGCLSTLISRASFLFGPRLDELRRFCDALPADQRAGCGTIPRP